MNKKIKKRMINKKEKNVRIYSIFLILILGLTLIPLVSAIGEEYKPYLHNPIVQETPGLGLQGVYGTDLWTGAAVYNYPIEVPLGTRGLAPFLGINYNSQLVTQRPGILGAGWQITSNYILRNVNGTLDDSGDDYFILVFM